MVKTYKSAKIKRKVRVRHKLKAVADRFRLVVYRSNKHIYAQIIDDSKGLTLASSSDVVLNKPAKPATKASAAKSKSKTSLKSTSASTSTKTAQAELVGTDLAQKAVKANVTKVYFDRGHYKFHGRIKSLAQAARKGGLEF